MNPICSLGSTVWRPNLPQSFGQRAVWRRLFTTMKTRRSCCLRSIPPMFRFAPPFQRLRQWSFETCSPKKSSKPRLCSFLNIAVECSRFRRPVVQVHAPNENLIAHDPRTKHTNRWLQRDHMEPLDGALSTLEDRRQRSTHRHLNDRRRRPRHTMRGVSFQTRLD